MSKSTYARFTRICQDCGAKMENVGPTRKYCPTCVARRAVQSMCASKARQRAEAQKKKEENERLKRLETAFPKPKKTTSGDSLGAVLARADAAGRTYGQQVEYERRQKELRDRGEI